MNIGIIIQARMESTRLPGKVYKKILDKHLLEHVILRVKKAKVAKKIIVAIPDTKKSAVLLPLIKKNKADFYLGSQDNVLDRYIKAAEKFKLDTVVRITADCPLIDPFLINEAVNKYQNFERKPDYFLIDGYPRGLGDIEFITLKALEKTISLTKNPYHLENVVSFILENPNLFEIKIEKVNTDFFRPKFRICVDEKQDLILVKKIFEHFKPKENFSYLDIINFLDKNPKIANINENVKQKT